jgi:co-chaperonin GroES (HSP10)
MADVKKLYLGVDFMTPTEDRILIKRLKKEVVSLTGGGLIVASGRKMNSKGEFIDEEVQGTAEEENTYYAEVIEVGPKVVTVTKEHKVMITRFAGIELTSGSNIYMIKEGDVIALVA